MMTTVTLPVYNKTDDSVSLENFLLHTVFEPHREKTGFLHMRKQRRLCFRYIDNTIPLLSKSEI